MQLGGQNGKIQILRKGDVVLLPAGVAHKRLDGTENLKSLVLILRMEIS